MVTFVITRSNLSKDYPRLKYDITLDEIIMPLQPAANLVKNLLFFLPRCEMSDTP